MEISEVSCRGSHGGLYDDQVDLTEIKGEKEPSRKVKSEFRRYPFENGGDTYKNVKRNKSP